MAFKEISIGLGIAAGAAGVANSGYGLYDRLIIGPELNAHYNDALLGQTPIIVESVEIQPNTGLAMRVEVTVKIFPSGDILVESGDRRQFIPFGLTADAAPWHAFVRTANAAETTVIDGVSYDVEVVKYTERVTRRAEDRLERVRTYADGTVETSIIDARSNKVVESRTERVTLDEAALKAIASSPYRKKIFRAR